MHSPNPWQTLDKKIAYRDDNFEIHRDKVIQPDGKPGWYTYLTGKVVVVVVALNNRGQVALVEQWRYVLRRRTLEVIAGTADAGEKDPLKIARRELKEEGGMTAKKWTELSTSYVAHAKSPWHYYLAENLTLGQPHPEGTEDITVRWLPLKDALARVDAGIISNFGSTLGLLLADRWLRQRHGRV